ncbi:unnamed protein product [Acanthosepion pharaonis]|uniref:Rotatin N-terminal domain-containing protein n=1 Tax=Acanthosepion pharaonis TaxID=158019 RepID=A0A812CDL5_ACAPH|nr:unnamed protein product [Sepia pharaonis]
MSTSLRDDVNLARIFEKLGHQLEEIRVRALTNILSKLDHKLVSLHDLIQEKHFLIRLLEWFNFPNAPKQSEVIDLMYQLSQVHDFDSKGAFRM